MDDAMMDDMHHHDDMMMMDDMDMDMDMSMEMTMTFQDWDEYKVTILWDQWEVKEKWQYALSWFAIVLAAAFYHVFRFANEWIKQQLLIPNQGNADVDVGLISNKSSTPSSTLKWRIAHALVSGASYGYALLLMLVAMTYNPGLLCALMTGYALGDFAFPPTRNSPSNQGLAECCN